MKILRSLPGMQRFGEVIFVIRIPTQKSPTSTGHRKPQLPDLCRMRLGRSFTRQYGPAPVSLLLLILSLETQTPSASCTMCSILLQR